MASSRLAAAAATMQYLQQPDAVITASRTRTSSSPTALLQPKDGFLDVDEEHSGASKDVISSGPAAIHHRDQSLNQSQGQGEGEDTNNMTERMREMRSPGRRSVGSSHSERTKSQDLDSVRAAGRTRGPSLDLEHRSPISPERLVRTRAANVPLMDRSDDHHDHHDSQRPDHVVHLDQDRLHVDAVAAPASLEPSDRQRSTRQQNAEATTASSGARASVVLAGVPFHDSITSHHDQLDEHNHEGHVDGDQRSQGSLPRQPDESLADVVFQRMDVLREDLAHDDQQGTESTAEHVKNAPDDHHHRHGADTTESNSMSSHLLLSRTALPAAPPAPSRPLLRPAGRHSQLPSVARGALEDSNYLSSHQRPASRAVKAPTGRRANGTLGENTASRHDSSTVQPLPHPTTRSANEERGNPNPDGNNPIASRDHPPSLSAHLQDLWDVTEGIHRDEGGGLASDGRLREPFGTPQRRDASLTRADRRVVVTDDGGRLDVDDGPPRRDQTSNGLATSSQPNDPFSTRDHHHHHDPSQRSAHIDPTNETSAVIPTQPRNYQSRAVDRSSNADNNAPADDPSASNADRVRTTSGAGGKDDAKNDDEEVSVNGGWRATAVDLISRYHDDARRAEGLRTDKEQVAFAAEQQRRHAAAEAKRRALGGRRLMAPGAGADSPMTNEDPKLHYGSKNGDTSDTVERDGEARNGRAGIPSQTNSDDNGVSDAEGAAEMAYALEAISNGASTSHRPRTAAPSVPTTRRAPKSAALSEDNRAGMSADRDRRGVGGVHDGVTPPTVTAAAKQRDSVARDSASPDPVRRDMLAAHLPLRSGSKDVSPDPTELSKFLTLRRPSEDPLGVRGYEFDADSAAVEQERQRVEEKRRAAIAIEEAERERARAKAEEESIERRRAAKELKQRQREALRKLKEHKRRARPPGADESSSSSDEIPSTDDEPEKPNENGEPAPAENVEAPAESGTADLATPNSTLMRTRQGARAFNDDPATDGADNQDLVTLDVSVDGGSASALQPSPGPRGNGTGNADGANRTSPTLAEASRSEVLEGRGGYGSDNDDTDDLHSRSSAFRRVRRDSGNTAHAASHPQSHTQSDIGAGDGHFVANGGSGIGDGDGDGSPHADGESTSAALGLRRGLASLQLPTDSIDGSAGSPSLVISSSIAGAPLGRDTDHIDVEGVYTSGTAGSPMRRVATADPISAPRYNHGGSQGHGQSLGEETDQHGRRQEYYDSLDEDGHPTRRRLLTIDDDDEADGENNDTFHDHGHDHEGRVDGELEWEGSGARGDRRLRPSTGSTDLVTSRDPAQQEAISAARRQRAAHRLDAYRYYEPPKERTPCCVIM